MTSNSVANMCMAAGFQPSTGLVTTSAPAVQAVNNTQMACFNNGQGTLCMTVAPLDQGLVTEGILGTIGAAILPGLGSTIGGAIGGALGNQSLGQGIGSAVGTAAGIASNFLPF